jgi:hypothetical protein
MATTTPRLLRHPGLTITVYRVTASGHRQPVRTTRFRPGATAVPEVTTAWAPCRCPRCRPGEQAVNDAIGR